jgi:hypothetical protein
MCEEEGVAATHARKRGGADAREEESTVGVGCGVVVAERVSVDEPGFRRRVAPNLYPRVAPNLRRITSLQGRSSSRRRSPSPPTNPPTRPQLAAHHRRSAVVEPATRGG